MLPLVNEGQDTAFQPEEIRVLTAAFDKAWEAVQANAVQVDTKRLADAAARTIIAKHIIEAARQGERDQGRLRDGALIAYVQANLRAPLQASETRRVRTHRRAIPGSLSAR
jgi:hypothetical protein